MPKPYTVILKTGSIEYVTAETLEELKSHYKPETILYVFEDWKYPVRL
jgi:hypothetical protein